MASNTWVIHGNHTKNGKPILASDPHLGNQLPGVWYMMSMHYDDNYFSGATHPGIPYTFIGRTKYFAWSLTSILGDLSDLYDEKLN